MDAATLEEAVEADYETELSRLGSSKALYAVTGGEMEADPVLGEMAGRYLAAAAVLDAWAADGGPGAAAFDSVAAAARSGADRLAGAADDAEVTSTRTALEDVLDGIDETAARAGGLLAWALVTDRTLSQVVGFFVGNARTGEASLARDLREDVDDARVAALGLLDDVCAGEADWDRAREAAGGAVEAAYGHYVEALESMGIKVKPVC